MGSNGMEEDSSVYADLDVAVKQCKAERGVLMDRIVITALGEIPQRNGRLKIIFRYCEPDPTRLLL